MVRNLFYSILLLLFSVPKLIALAPPPLSAEVWEQALPLSWESIWQDLPHAPIQDLLSTLGLGQVAHPIKLDYPSEDIRRVTVTVPPLDFDTYVVSGHSLLRELFPRTSWYHLKGQELSFDIYFYQNIPLALKPNLDQLHRHTKVNYLDLTPYIIPYSEMREISPEIWSQYKQLWTKVRPLMPKLLDIPFLNPLKKPRFFQVTYNPLNLSYTIEDFTQDSDKEPLPAGITAKGLIRSPLFILFPTVYNPANPYNYEADHDVIKDFLHSAQKYPFQPGDTISDWGCGSGLISWLLAQQNQAELALNREAVDVNPFAVATAYVNLTQIAQIPHIQTKRRDFFVSSTDPQQPRTFVATNAPAYPEKRELSKLKEMGDVELMEAVCFSEELFQDYGRAGFNFWNHFFRTVRNPDIVDQTRGQVIAWHPEGCEYLNTEFTAMTKTPGITLETKAHFSPASDVNHITYMVHLGKSS